MPASPPVACRALAAALAVAMALCGLACGNDPTRQTAAPKPAADPADPSVRPVDPQPAEPSPRRLERTSLRRGDALAHALQRVGLSGTELTRAVAAIDPLAPVRRLRSGTGMVAAHREGRCVGLWIRPETERYIELTRRGEDWSATWQSIPLRTEIVTASGHLESSVSQTLDGAEGGAALVLAYADVFQWDVDLLVDPRPGDSIRVIYELHRLDEIPAELPGFAGAPEQAGSVIGVGRILAASYDGRQAQAEAFWVESDDAAGNYFDGSGRPLRKTFLKSPLNYRRVSSGFSIARRHPITGKVRPHRAVDFAAPHGTAVSATADGTVHKVGWMGPLGRAVMVRHNAEYTTVYGHLSSIAKGIRRGVRVEQNQVIGRVGSTGSATGPHLHYELHRYGKRIDPLKFKSPAADPLAEEDWPLLTGAMLRWQPVLARLETAPTATIAAERP